MNEVLNANPAVAQVFKHAVRLFDGSEEAAMRWFQAPARALGNESPISRVGTEAGIDQIDALISRLESGIVT